MIIVMTGLAYNSPVIINYYSTKMEIHCTYNPKKDTISWIYWSGATG